ncbi:uncharacterized protein LOC102155734 isoform X2 [Canis lupus familiaris]|uniref:uncharacterized protein LOC102155734 isoform X2 n=1 Tax=Canis lupus familiaris TaxID=9615 RepID=UPI0018F4C03B|nr:uncharacterized protein LOC102155734 isoform X2 [Canis lupus familiaris]
MGHGRPQGRRRAGVPQQTHFGRDSALATRSLCSLFTRSLDQARDSGPCASVAPSTRSYLATALGDTPGETTVIPDDLLFPEHASKWTLSHAGVTMPSAGAGHAPTLRGQAHGQASSWCGKALGLVCDSASAPGGAQAPEVRRSPCVTLRETPACGTAQHAAPHPLRCYQESLTGLKPHKVHSPKRTFTHLT